MADNEFLAASVTEKVEDALDAVTDALKILDGMEPSEVMQFPDYTGYHNWMKNMSNQLSLMKITLLRRCNHGNRQDV